MTDTPLFLDLRGLKCPWPVLRTRRALEAIAPGAQLKIACTDPMAALDIHHLTYETGDHLLHIHTEGDGQIFHIQKASKP